MFFVQDGGGDARPGEGWGQYPQYATKLLPAVSADIYTQGYFWLFWLT